MKAHRLEAELRQEQLLRQQEEFFSEILARIAEGKYPRILPKGTSMRPFIRGLRDTIVLGQLTAESLQVGRVVLAKIPQGYLVHRIVRIEGERIILRGDGNRSQQEVCSREEILAEVLEVQRGKQRIRPGDRLWWRYEHLWPRSPLLRRLLLALYRRTLLRWGL